MPEPKDKSENYSNLGGVNRKISPYITPDNNMLTVENLDFRTTGSLSTTPGITQFSTRSATTMINGIVDFFSLGYTAARRSVTYSIIATNLTDACDVTGGTFLSVYQYVFPQTNSLANPINNAPFSFSRSGYLYGANGYDAFSYFGGTQAVIYGLPKPSFWHDPLGSWTIRSPGGLSGALALYFAYQRTDGLYGPAILGFSQSTTSSLTSVAFFLPQLASSYGESYGSFGISGLAVWAGFNGLIYGSSTLLTPGSGFTFTPSYFSAMVADSHSLDFPVQPEEYFGTFFYGFFSDNGSFERTNGSLRDYPPQPGDPLPIPNNPTVFEFYYNQLFAGGFSQFPDTVWFSNIGELEKHDFENNFEFRAGDGDIITCLKAYFTQLAVFKSQSCGTLSGTDPDNFQLTEVSDQYGCISARGACVWEQNLWFLDAKGIAYFNGANTKIISDAVEDYFLRMNVTAAKTQAIMLHVKERNEVWCAIPIDGASYNNIVIIFDYSTPQGAWRTRTINQVTAINRLNRGIDKEHIYQGNFSGSITSYGHSLTTDLGVGITQTFKTRFHAELGHSVEKQWRRLYLDAVIPQGSTQVFGINFYVNQGTVPALSTTMILSRAQNRMEIGLPGRDLAFELFYNGTQFLQFNGYTLEYRMQRPTGSNAN